jgi:hypothetical protein
LRVPSYLGLKLVLRNGNLICREINNQWQLLIFFQETEPKVETKFAFRELDLAKDNSILDPTRPDLCSQTIVSQSVTFLPRIFSLQKNGTISDKFEKPKRIK